MNKMCTQIFYIDCKKNCFGDLTLNTRTINCDCYSSRNPQIRVCLNDKEAITRSVPSSVGLLPHLELAYKLLSLRVVVVLLTTFVKRGQNRQSPGLFICDSCVGRFSPQ
jgi:hypothetical protein